MDHLQRSPGAAGLRQWVERSKVEHAFRLNTHSIVRALLDNSCQFRSKVSLCPEHSIGGSGNEASFLQVVFGVR